MANETFLSYARKDKEQIKRLFDALLGCGIDLWLDLEDIRGATVWSDALLTAIQNCHNFIYAISEHSLESPYCQIELSHALRLNKRIIPVLIADVNPDFCPQPIRELQWLFLNKKFDAAIDELVGIIESPEGASWGERLDCKVEIISRNRPTRLLGLYRKKYLVGRCPETTIEDSGIIAVEDPQRPKRISRTHFKLSLKVGRWHVEDVSKNGTKLNGRELLQYENRPLKHRDVIAIPSYKLIYQEIYTSDLKVELDSSETGV